MSFQSVEPEAKKTLCGTGKYIEKLKLEDDKRIPFERVQMKTALA